MSLPQSYAASDGGGRGSAEKPGGYKPLEGMSDHKDRHKVIRKNKVGDAKIVMSDDGFYMCSKCKYKNKKQGPVKLHLITHSQAQYSCQIPGCTHLNKDTKKPELWASTNSVKSHYEKHHRLTRKEAGAFPKKPYLFMTDVNQIIVNEVLSRLAAGNMTGVNQIIANEVLSRLAAGKMLPTSTDAGGGGGGGSGAARDSNRRLEEEEDDDDDDDLVTNDKHNEEAASAGTRGGGSGWEEHAAKDAAAPVAALLETHAESTPSPAHHAEPTAGADHTDSTSSQASVMGAHTKSSKKENCQDINDRWHNTYISGTNFWKCPYCKTYKNSKEFCLKHINSFHVCTETGCEDLFINKEKHYARKHPEISLPSKNYISISKVRGSRHPIFQKDLKIFNDEIKQKCIYCQFCNLPCKEEWAVGRHLNISPHCFAHYKANDIEMPRATILDQPDTRRYLDEPGDGDEDVESGTIDGGHERAPAEFGDPAAMLLTVGADTENSGEFEQEEDGAAGEAPPRVLFSRTVCKKGQEKSLGEGEGDGSGAGRRKKKSARKRKPAEAVVPDCDVGHETYYQDRPASTYDGGGGSGWEKERAGKKPKKNIISLCRLCSNAMAEEGMLDSPDELLTEIIILPDEKCNECACQDDCESRKK